MKQFSKKLLLLGGLLATLAIMGLQTPTPASFEFKVNIAQAQSGLQTVTLCVDKAGAVAVNKTDQTCPAGRKALVVNGRSAVTCILKSQDGFYEADQIYLTTNGDCKAYEEQNGKQVDVSNQIGLKTIIWRNQPVYDPVTGGISTPGINPPTTNPPTTKPPTTKPPTGTTGTGGTTGGTTPQNQGKCDSGYHESGPLCVPNSPFGNDNKLLGANTASSLAVNIVTYLIYFATIIAVGYTIYGGYLVLTATSNEAQAKDGRKTLTNAIVGLVIVILSYVIITLVIRTISG